MPVAGPLLATKSHMSFVQTDVFAISYLLMLTEDEICRVDDFQFQGDHL